MSKSSFYNAIRENYAICSAFAALQRDGRGIIRLLTDTQIESDIYFDSDKLSGIDLAEFQMGTITPTVKTIIKAAIEDDCFDLERYEYDLLAEYQYDHCDDENDDEYDYEEMFNLKDEVLNKFDTDDDFVKNFIGDNNEAIAQNITRSVIDHLDENMSIRVQRFKTDGLAHTFTAEIDDVKLDITLDLTDDYSKIECYGQKIYANHDFYNARIEYPELKDINYALGLIEKNNFKGQIDFKEQINSLNTSPFKFLESHVFKGIFNNTYIEYINFHQQHSHSIFNNKSELAHTLPLIADRPALLSDFCAFISQHHQDQAEQFIFDYSRYDQENGKKVASAYVDLYIQQSHLKGFPSADLVLFSGNEIAVINSDLSRNDEGYLSCKLQLALRDPEFTSEHEYIEQQQLEFQP